MQVIRGLFYTQITYWPGVLMLLSLLFIHVHSYSQDRTIGLFLNSEESYDGYTLFAPVEYTSTYLINNCGEKVHEWTSDYKAGLMAYLRSDGRLLRAGYTPNSNFIQAIGLGGIIEIINKDSEVEWSGRISNNIYAAHHDIEPLENGNFFVTAYEKLSVEEAEALGRDPYITSDDLFSTVILEIKPIGRFDMEIVWEWHALDHIVQDYSMTIANYGNPTSSPRKIDFNYVTASPPVWIHDNSIDYNEERDEIVLSSRNFGEMWVIDHSTTTSEAATSMGGDKGHGGDLLYRWGNTNTYQTNGTTWLEGQHDAQWIESGLPGAGNFLVYNNFLNYEPSNIVEIQPSIDADGNYILNADGVFEPADPYNILELGSDSPVMSGVQRLPNGNTLTCNSIHSHFIEFDEDANQVWKYYSPVSLNGPESQGSNNPDWTFKIRRLSTHDQRLEGYDLTPKGLIELNPLDEECTLFPEIVSSNDILEDESIVITSNSIVSSKLNFIGESLLAELAIYSSDGHLVFNRNRVQLPNSLDLDFLKSGFYVLLLKDLKTGNLIRRKFIKH